MKDCGRDNECITDLHLEARLLSSEPTDFIVVGDYQPFTLETSVENEGEAAYMTEVKVLFPRHLSFMRVRTISQIGYKVACIPENTKGETHLVMCEIGNPIPKHETIIFQLTFDTAKVTENVQELNMTFEAVTMSTEDDALLGDNMKELKIPVKVHTELDVDA